MSNTFKVQLINVQTLGARCGYGEGDELDKAIENACEQIADIDPNPVVVRWNNGARVEFAGGVNC